MISGTSKKYLPKYPIYIVSKGRAGSRYTVRALEHIGIPYYIAVEEHEYEDYCAVIDRAKVLKLPFSNHGKGSGPARNWCWEHSIANGFKRHWILDDNIMEFWRWNYNQRIRLESGSFFQACENFVDRYTNVMLSGLQYKFFAIDDYKYAPFLVNTRLMSCILIQNDCKHRWRGRYNEDVDLSLRVLKDGDCTVLFYSFLQGKLRTGTVKGGNTSEIYGDGTYKKSKMLADLHPDVVKITRRYGRWHHSVDIRSFRSNLLIRDESVIIPTEPNEYGLKLLEGYGTDTEILVDKPETRDKLGPYYTSDILKAPYYV